MANKSYVELLGEMAAAIHRLKNHDISPTAFVIDLTQVAPLEQALKQLRGKACEAEERARKLEQKLESCENTLANREEELEQALEAARGLVTTRDGMLADRKREIDELHHVATTNCGWDGKEGTASQAIRDHIKKLASGSGSQEESIPETHPIYKRLGTLTNQVDALCERLSGIDSSLDKLRDCVMRHTCDIKEMDESLNQHQYRIAKLESLFDDLKQDQTSLESLFHDLEQDQENQGSRIVDLEDKE